MSAWTKWLVERDSDPPCYSPLDEEENAVVVGMAFMGDLGQDREVVGEFWFDDDGEIHVKLAEAAHGDSAKQS